MNIAQAAAASGLPAKTIRYYEEIGLVRPQRGDNGYRRFDGKSLHKLTFLARARSLGFSIEECRALLALYEDQGRASAEVKALTVAHLAQVRAKIAELHEMQSVLSRLIESCAGDARPDCPILGDLAGAPACHRS
jgi:Cu(I)-responsive transcriptional regulator